MEVDLDLFGGFEEAPRRTSSGVVAQLRDENAALRQQLAVLTAARGCGSMPELLTPVCEARREALCSVTFYPHAPLELRHALERVLRSARAAPPLVAGDAGAWPPANGAEPGHVPSVRAEPDPEVHYLQAYCWDAAGEASGWAALQQSTLAYHRPLPLVETDTIVFSAHASADARGRRGGRRGGGSGDGRRYWELELGPDPDCAGAPAGEQAGAAPEQPTPGVLSRALMDALGMSAGGCEPPPYLRGMRQHGYPPAYEVCQEPAGAAAAAAAGGALLFFDAPDGTGRPRRDGDVAEAPAAAAPAAAAGVEAAQAAEPPAAPAGTERAPSPAAARAEAEEGELPGEAPEGQGADGRPAGLAPPSGAAGRLAAAALAAPPAAPAGSGPEAARQLFAYPGLNAPPPEGADPRAWSALYHVQPAAQQHAAPGPMRGGAACWPQPHAAGPPQALPHPPYWGWAGQPHPAAMAAQHGYPPACYSQATEYARAACAASAAFAGGHPCLYAAAAASAAGNQGYCGYPQPPAAPHNGLPGHPAHPSRRQHDAAYRPY